MAELKARLQADLTGAMKARDRLRTATLRMLLAAIQTEEVSGKQARELSDDEVLKVLSKESRKRGEAADQEKKIVKLIADLDEDRTSIT